MKVVVYALLVSVVLVCSASNVTSQSWGKIVSGREDPTNLDAFAAAMTKQGNFLRAVEAYEKLVELYPKDPGLYINLSRCQLELDEFEKAVTSARVAVRLSPRDHAARNNLGWGLVSFGQTEDGVAELRTAVWLDPNAEPARTNLGIALLMLHRDKEAIDELKAALAIERYSIRARLALIFAYDRSGLFSLA